MPLRLRLARIRTPGGSKKHAPIYNIVLAQARSARDSKPMEVLGTYDPIPKTPIGAEATDRKVKDIKVDVARAKYWLGVGAQPSDTVWRLLSMVREDGSRRADERMAGCVKGRRGLTEEQIGLLEPRYLPGGQHNEQGLKAVRFPTHTPRSEQKKSAAPSSSTRRSTTSRGGGIYDNKTSAPSGARTGAENTSPMDPNAV